MCLSERECDLALHAYPMGLPDPFHGPVSHGKPIVSMNGNPLGKLGWVSMGKNMKKKMSFYTEIMGFGTKLM